MFTCRITHMVRVPCCTLLCCTALHCTLRPCSGSQLFLVFFVFSHVFLFLSFFVFVMVLVLTFSAYMTKYTGERIVRRRRPGSGPATTAPDVCGGVEVGRRAAGDRSVLRGRARAESRQEPSREAHGPHKHGQHAGNFPQ